MVKIRINLGSFEQFLVQFGLRIMCKEGTCEVQIFGFFRSKSSNLEGQKIWEKKYVDEILYGYLNGNV